MSLLDQLGGVLQHYSNTGTPPQPQQAIEHYQQVASQSPPSAISSALATVFRSPQTGTFGQNVGSLFGQSDPNQRAGILNTLLASGAAGAIVSRLGLTPGTNQVSPEQAQQVPASTVEQVADDAQQHDPSIVDRAGEFYAQHPTLVGALGAGAAIMALQHLARR